MDQKPPPEIVTRDEGAIETIRARADVGSAFWRWHIQGVGNLSVRRIAPSDTKVSSDTIVQ